MAYYKKMCQYPSCRKPFTTTNFYQPYCDECLEERINDFKANREYKTCQKCRHTFLSIGGQTLCDRCRKKEGERIGIYAKIDVGKEKEK